MLCIYLTNFFCFLNEKLQENIKDVENRLTCSQREIESLKKELQLALISIDTQRR